MQDISCHTLKGFVWALAVLGGNLHSCGDDACLSPAHRRAPADGPNTLSPPPGSPHLPAGSLFESLYDGLTVEVAPDVAGPVILCVRM